MKIIKSTVMVLILFLIFTIGIAEEFTPISRDEAEEWLKSVTYEELLDFIIQWNFVDNSIPYTEVPSAIAILDKKGNLYITYKEPVFIEIGCLKYNFVMQDQTIERFYKPEKGKRARSFLIGLLAGVGFGVIIE